MRSAASHCGHNALAAELRRRYGGEKDFKTGLRENDLSKYDRVWGLACGKLEEDLEAFLEVVRARDPQ